MFSELRRYGWVLGVVASIGLISVLLSLWDGWFPWYKVGPISEWMAALGTVLAVIVALAASSRTEVHQADSNRRALEMLEAQRRNQEAERRTASRSVVASEEFFCVDPGAASGEERHVRFRVTVGNYSSHPVRAVRVHLIWNLEAVAELGVKWKVWENGGLTEKPVGEMSTDTLCDVLVPGSSILCEPTHIYTAQPPCVFEARALDEFRLQFIDVHGDEWLAYFGRRLGNDARVQRISNTSGFWVEEADPDPPHVDTAAARDMRN